MSPTDLIGLLPLIILAGGGLTLLAAAMLPQPLPRPLLTLAAVAFLLTAGAAAGWLWEVPGEIAGLLRADPLAQLFAPLLTLAGAGVVILAHDHRPSLWQGQAEYLALILFSCLGALLLASADHLLAAFLGLETLAIPLYALVAWRPDRPTAIEGGIKFALLAGFAAAIFLFGISLAYAAAGTLSLEGLAAVAVQDPLMPAAITLVLAAIGFKLAAVPFHMWTPDVYEAAPAPVTALFATVAKAAALVFLVRILGLPMLWQAMLPLLWVIAAATMTAGNLLALRQQKLKRLLAYSSIAHMGYLFVALAAGSAFGRQAAIYYTVAYVVMNLGVFAFVAALAGSGSDRRGLEEYRGAGRRHPLLGLGLAVSLLALAGVPPTAGFTAKLLAFAAAVEAGYTPLALIAVLNTALAFFYYLHVLRIVFADDGPATFNAAPGLGSTGVAVTATLIILGLGLFPHWLPSILTGTVF